MKLNVSEFFTSIQGEGKFAGCPSIFIRLCQCTRECKFCDTAYHKTGKLINIIALVKKISNQSIRHVVITGGEPLLQWKEIVEFRVLLNKEKHFILNVETNGDLLYNRKVSYSELFSVFDYVAISPKELSRARLLNKELAGPLSRGICDIKVVTDMKAVGLNMIKYATTLMPLTTYNSQKDLVIKQLVWSYCQNHNIRYSPRLQVDLWNKERQK